MAEQTQAIDPQERPPAPEIGDTGVRADVNDFAAFDAAMKQRKRGGAPEATPAQGEAENKANQGGKAKAKAEPESDGSKKADPDGKEAGKKPIDNKGNPPKWMKDRIARSNKQKNRLELENEELRKELAKARQKPSEATNDSGTEPTLDLTGPNWEHFVREDDDEETAKAGEIAYLRSLGKYLSDEPYDPGPYAPKPEESQEETPDPEAEPSAEEQAQIEAEAEAQAKAEAEEKAAKDQERRVNASNALAEAVDALAKGDPNFQLVADSFLEAVFGQEQKLLLSAEMAEHIIGMPDDAARRVIQTLLERPARATLIYNKPESQAIEELNRIASSDPSLPGGGQQFRQNVETMPGEDGTPVVVDDFHGVVGEGSQIPLDTPDFAQFEARMAMNRERKHRAYRNF